MRWLKSRVLEQRGRLEVEVRSGDFHLGPEVCPGNPHLLVALQQVPVCFVLTSTQPRRPSPVPIPARRMIPSQCELPLHFTPPCCARDSSLPNTHADGAYPPPQPLQYGYNTIPYQPPPQSPYAYARLLQQQHQNGVQQPSFLGITNQQTPQPQPPQSAPPLPHQQQQSQAPPHPVASPGPAPKRGRGKPGKQPQAVPENALDPSQTQPDAIDADYERNLIDALGSGTQQTPQPQQEQTNSGAEASQGEEGGGNGDEEDEPVFHLPPPPDGIFPNAEQLEKHIHAWSLEHGYEMVRRASKRNASGQLYKRYYHCSRHGKMANTGRLTDRTRQRLKRKSNRIGCPMSLAAVACDPQNADGDWQIRLRKTHHNHGPLDAISMPGHRRRARMGGVEQAVDGLFAIGSSTAQVLTFLQRTNPNGLFTRTDVSNMKLNYNHYGTCVNRKEEMKQGNGYPSACTNCRAKKIRCNSVRPTCGTCERTNATCRYDHDLTEAHPTVQQRNGGTNQNSLEVTGPDTSAPPTTASAAPSPTTATAVPSPNQSTTRFSRSSGVSNHQQNIADASTILANLAAANPSLAHPTPTAPAPIRLTLQSSSVETLARTSCGAGESYRNLPILSSPSDWPTYSSAFLTASNKENTRDVLVGEKREPQPPKPGRGEHEVGMEVHNEYIRQLAIYNRRNGVLLATLWETLARHWRERVGHLRRACEVWDVLEDECRPRGSGGAFKAFGGLVGCTLEGCGGDLGRFVEALEEGQREFNGFAPRDVDAWASLRKGEGRFMSEEMLMFLFLRGLGSGAGRDGEGSERAAFWRKWAEGLCATANVGGFGTGPRLGWKDVVQRAKEVEGMGAAL